MDLSCILPGIGLPNVLQTGLELFQADTSTIQLILHGSLEHLLDGRLLATGTVPGKKLFCLLNVFNYI